MRKEERGMRRMKEKRRAKGRSERRKKDKNADRIKMILTIYTRCDL